MHLNHYKVACWVLTYQFILFLTSNQYSENVSICMAIWVFSVPCLRIYSIIRYGTSNRSFDLTRVVRNIHKRKWLSLPHLPYRQLKMLCWQEIYSCGKRCGILQIFMFFNVYNCVIWNIFLYNSSRVHISGDITIRRQ